MIDLTRIHRSLRGRLRLPSVPIRASGDHLLLGAIALLPEAPAYRLAGLVGRARYYRPDTARAWRLAAIQGRLGIERGSAEALLKRAYELVAADDLEYWLIPRLTPARLARLIRYEGLEHLDRALDRGHGVVLYSGHTTGSRLVVAGLAALGYRLTLLHGARDRSHKDPLTRRLHRRYRAALDRWGAESIAVNPFDRAPSTGLRSIGALRRNRIVGVKVDFRFAGRDDDAEVAFLDGEVRFPSGGAAMARTGGAPLIHLWAGRPAGFPPSIATIGEPDDVGDLQEAIQRQAARLEAEIRADPASWCYWTL